MRALGAARLLRRARALLRPAAVEREMDAEMRLHIELEIEDRIRRGMSPAEARRTALVAFGGLARFKEEGRAARGVQPLEEFARDVRHVLRVLRQSPVFTLSAALSLALGIGATTVVTSVVHTVLRPPLAVRAPERLFVVTEARRNGINTTMGQQTFPYERYLAYRAATGDVFAGVAGYLYGAMSLRADGDARVLGGVIVSANYFEVLGVRPALGRFFAAPSAHLVGAEPEVVISFDLWQRELAGDPGALGRTLHVDGRALTVVGVAARDFTGTMAGLAADVWIPAAVYAQAPAGAAGTERDAVRRAPQLTIIGRLPPTLPVSQANAALERIARHLPDDGAPPSDLIAARLEPLRGIPAMARGAAIGFMGMLAVTAGLVLLIAATNVAGVLLARALHRQREVAVRLALGAGRGRLVRQLVAESVALCLLGGAMGVVVARWLLALVTRVQPPVPGRAAALGLDPVVLAIALAVTLTVGVLAGLTPALQSARTDLLSVLRGGEAGEPARSTRLRTGFVVAQLAMSLVLLVTAGLFTRALQRALAIDPGFDPAGVVVARINVGAHGYAAERAAAFHARLLERLRSRPEVAAAAIGEWTPLGSRSHGEPNVQPEPAPVGRKPSFAYFGVVDTGYFATVRTAIVAGRAFTAEDRSGAPPTIIVNEALARRLWPGESPLGKRVVFGRVTREVIGVARDGKYLDVGERPTSYAFLPLAQQHPPSALHYYVRARGRGADALATLRRELNALDPDIALEGAMPLAAWIDVRLLPQRFAAWLIGGFGLVGLALAAIGIYGVLAYHVAQRTREFGVRLALGARGADLVRLVLRRGLALVGLGAALGTAAALAVGHLARRFLYGIGATDPITFVTVSLLFLIVALAASYIPARRAARVDPMRSLRVE